jgi:peptide/nickel transport system substrate-binding protein
VYSYAIDQDVQGVRMGPIFEPSDRLANLPGWYLLSKVGEAAGPSATP